MTRASVEAHRLPWHVHRLGPRSGYAFQPVPIRSGAEGRACADELLTRLVRVWLANRGGLGFAARRADGLSA